VTDQLRGNTALRAAQPPKRAASRHLSVDRCARGTKPGSPGGALAVNLLKDAIRVAEGCDGPRRNA